MEAKQPTEKCPVCERNIDRLSHQPTGDAKAYDCTTCGRYTLTGSASAEVRSLRLNKKDAGPLLSHAIRKMQRPDEWPMLTAERAKQIVEMTALPTVAEQADILVLWLGDTRDPGGPAYVDGRLATAVIGALSRDGFALIATGLKEAKLIEGNLIPGGEGSFALSFAGWQRYEALKRGRADSRRAFMVMPYNDAKLDRVFNECFKPAVTATGFTLVRLDDGLRAGVIDDHLRNEIATARFLIVELTGNNCNAYWEAGYGEGLGRPVIYTCERHFFEKQKPYEEIGGTKFDTNHLTTVPWEEDKFDDAAERLKATIRVTLPGDAKLVD